MVYADFEIWVRSPSFLCVWTCFGLTWWHVMIEGWLLVSDLEHTPGTGKAPPSSVVGSFQLLKDTSASWCRGNCVFSLLCFSAVMEWAGLTQDRPNQVHDWHGQELLKSRPEKCIEDTEWQFLPSDTSLDRCLLSAVLTQLCWKGCKVDVPSGCSHTTSAISLAFWLQSGGHMAPGMWGQAPGPSALLCSRSWMEKASPGV